MERLQTVKLKRLGLHEYLCSLPPAILDSLYEHPATCMAVFRELPELAKYYIMRILFVEQPISKAAVSAWVKVNAKQDHNEAVKSMCSLRVWMESNLQGSASTAFIMSSIFRRNLQKALVGGGEPWSSTAHLGPDKHGKDIDSLDKYASERWEMLLHYLVGSETNSTISQDIKDLINQAGLMKQGSEGGRSYSIITAKGFQFLLLDNASQDLPTDGRDDHVLICLQHFREMGLVMQRKRKSRRFYPTYLAINLANRANASVTNVTNTRGFILAETNFRVYAYTDSELQYSILSLFCKMLYRFPNVCVLQLTRKSIQSAVVNGITADQILHYIKANAHPDMLKSDPIIAPTLADQVRLWAMERDRLTYRDGVLYNQFLAQKDFEVLRNYAKELGALIWENSSKRYMVVTKDGHDQVKRYWKKYKKETDT